MARALGLLSSALIAARGGMSANAYYRELRAEGIAARRSEVLQIFKLAKGITTRSPDEPFRDIRLIPSVDDIAPWPSKKATGISQTVTLVYRDKVTGGFKQVYWRTITPEGITREQAIATAINAYTGTPSGNGRDFVGAVHTSALMLTPGLVR